MNTLPEAQQIKQVIDNSNKVLIAIGKNPSLDAVAAGLSLYFGVQKSQKSCVIASPSNLTVELGNLIGVDKVTTSVGGNNLIISFDYSEGSIEKVSYNVENNKFNLIIQPKEGEAPPKKDGIDFSYGGANFDAIFTIGCQSLNDLDNLYTQEQKLYSEKPLISINYQTVVQPFAKINITDLTSSSNSEVIAKLLRSLNIGPDPDIGTNLLAGIFSATNNLQNCQYTADLFEIIAACLRTGGRLPAGVPSSFPMQHNLRPTQPQQLIQQQVPTQDKLPSQKPKVTQEPPSPDWLTPKIYKGSSLV